MEVRHVRGQIVGKRKDLWLLTKQWWLAIKDENGEVVDGQWVWHDADFGENVWHHKEQKMSERKILVGEGECLGIYHGKKNRKNVLKSVTLQLLYHVMYPVMSKSINPLLNLENLGKVLIF